MDISQIILVGVVSILTLLLVVVGLQVFLLLGDIRRTLAKINRVVNELGFNTTIEVLRFVFGQQKKQQMEKGSKREKKIFSHEREEEQGETLNGEKTTPSSLQIQFRAPRFFKGIPKRK